MECGRGGPRLDRVDDRFFPRTEGLQLSTDLVGKAADFHYASGNVLRQRWADGAVTWSGVEGAFVGVEQTEPTLRVFALGEQRYLLSWFEEATVATAAQGTVYEGGFPVTVYADFAAMEATACYSNPSEDGGVYFTVDQARIEWVD